MINIIVIDMFDIIPSSTTRNRLKLNRMEWNKMTHFISRFCLRAYNRKGRSNTEKFTERFLNTCGNSVEIHKSAYATKLKQRKRRITAPI